MNKKTALILFIVYAVALVLVLSFGAGVSSAIVSSIKSAIFNYNITDVKIALDPNVPLISKNVYYLNPEAIGSFDDDGDLVFESSNPPILHVSSDGKLTAMYNFDGAEANAVITVKSRQDTDFSKSFTFTVKKQYPEDFSSYYHIKGYDQHKSEVYLGMTVYPYALTWDGLDLHKNEFSVEYDEEYFRYDENEKGYIAIKETPPGEKVYFTLTYPNGASRRTDSFSIIPYTESDSFDKVVIREKDADGIKLVCDTHYIPQLYKDGSPLQTKVDISCSEPEKMILLHTGRYYFTDAGDYQLTFSLPNGFAKTVTVHVRNKMTLPNLTNSEIASTKHIKVYQNDYINLTFDFDSVVSYSEVSYEYDDRMLDINSYWRSFTVIGKNTGTTILKVIVDDGYERLEEEYTVEVIQNTEYGYLLGRAVQYFVSKVLGHLCLFGMLGILGYNLTRFIYTKKRFARYGILLSLGLAPALITEFIQTFMDGRTPAIGDVLIDMSGYLIGGLVCYLLLRSVDKRAKKTYFWCAVDTGGGMDEIRESMQQICGSLGKENPTLTLPMHISLKISVPIRTKHLPKITQKVTKILSSVNPPQISTEATELHDGVVWIRHKDSEDLRDLHKRITDILIDECGVMPHALDGEFIFHTSLFVGEAGDASEVYEAIREMPLPEQIKSDGYLIGISESGLAGEYRVIKTIKGENI